MNVKKLNEKQVELVNNHIFLAISRANIFMKSYKNHRLSLTLEDFISYAYEGLCEAALRYDVSRNYEFSTYAVSYIDGFIKTYAYKENSTIKIPIQTKNKEKAKHCRYLALNNALVVANTSTEQENETDTTLSSISCDKYSNTTEYDDIFTKDYVLFLSSKLKNEKDKIIFQKLTVDGCTLSSIADELGIHINTVSRRKAKIAQTLKKYMYA